MGKVKAMKKAKPVQGVYIGRRYWDCGMVQVFLCGKNERGFKALSRRFCIIGETYVLYEDGAPRYPKRAERSISAESSMTEDWEIQDSIAVETQDHDRQAKKFSKNPKWLTDFERLKTVCKGLNHADRKHLVEFLVRKLTFG